MTPFPDLRYDPNHTHSLCPRLGSVPLTVKFYFQNPPNFIAALHPARDLAASYILIQLRRQVSKHSEKVCTPVHTSLHSFPPHKKDRGKSHCYISLSSRGTSPLHSGDHRYINFCAGDTYLTTYLPVTSSSQETTPAPASSNHQPKLYTHHLFNTPTVKPTLHTRISTHFPTIFFMVWRL